MQSCSHHGLEETLACLPTCTEPLVPHQTDLAPYSCCKVLPSWVLSLAQLENIRGASVPRVLCALCLQNAAAAQRGAISHAMFNTHWCKFGLY